MKRFLTAVFFLSSLTGCENTLSCLISGNNVVGRIVYSGDINVDTARDVVIEYQYGSAFSSAAATHNQYSAKRNIHGLITFEYSLCAENDRDIVVRAYEDLNNNRILDAGEPHGIFDGTANGDATPVTVNVPANKSEWIKQKGVDFYLDTP